MVEFGLLNSRENSKKNSIIMGRIFLQFVLILPAEFRSAAQCALHNATFTIVVFK